MTPEDIKLLGQIFGPQSKLNEVPFAMGDPRAEEERRRQQALYEAERAKSRRTYSQAPLSDRLMATGRGLGYLGSSMLESTVEPFAKLGSGTAEGALSQYFTPKTPVESAALSGMAEGLEPVASFLEEAKIPDITPGMLTSPTRLIDDAARQASMGLQKGAKAAARSTEDILRSEFAKAPVGSIRLPETQREPDVNPLGFYSELGRAANSLKQEKGTGQQFLSQLRSMPGVKADELRWTGLDDFLSKKDKVTKSEIKDYLGANKVDVQEVRLGSGDFKPEPMVNIEDIRVEPEGDQGRWFIESPTGSVLARANSEEEARQFGVRYFNSQIAERNRVGASDADNTKFSSYSVPGGKNYRELLLTLPSNRPSIKNMSRAEYNAAVEAADRSGIQDFRSSHFDQPNILAHMRVSDFEQDGKRVMLIDEIQSDWGQQGRDKGFAEGLPPGYRAEQNADGKWVMYNPIGGRFSMVFDTKEAAENAVLSDSRLMGIPKAPFVTSTEGWVNLTLRRAIQEASEKGFDKVAIPAGSVQADRYNLSKYLNAIDYRKNDDGTYGVIGFDKDDNSVISENRLTEKQLADTVGKEMAQKIIKGEGEGFPDGTAPQREGYKKLSGVDLEVGGEGMKKFYDQIVPKYLNKLGSKFGTKVTRGTIKNAKGEDVPVHEMTITPQMRESVLTKGQPLFAAVPAVGLTQEEEYAAGGAIKKAAKAAKKAQKPQVNLEEGFDKFQREANLAKFLERSVIKKPVYHGTVNDIKQFDVDQASKRTGNPNAQLGIFSSGNPQEASRYATDFGSVEGGNVMPLYLNITNPKRLTYKEMDDLAMAMFDKDAPLNDWKNAGFADRQAKRYEAAKNLSREKRQELIDAGYDGAIVKIGGNDEYIAFYPEQIKSAIGNRGTYDITDPDITKAAGGSIKKTAKAAKAASKASEAKEQPIYWGMYRGYVGDDVSDTEPQFAAMDRNVAEYYAKKRASQTGLPPHLEMIYKQLDAGRKYGHTVPIDQHNRELLITQAYELQPEDIKGRYQLKKHGGRVKGNI